MSPLTPYLSIVSQLKLSSNIAIANCNVRLQKVSNDNIWDTVISSDERWKIVSVFKSWNHLACSDIQCQYSPEKEGHQFSISVAYSSRNWVMPSWPLWAPAPAVRMYLYQVCFYELWSRCSFLSYTNLNGLHSNMKELTALSQHRWP